MSANSVWPSQRSGLKTVTTTTPRARRCAPAIEERAGGADGRDHHPHGITVWLAGAGVKRGFVHGATDALGFDTLEPGHYVTDLHATVLHLMGLNGRLLEIPGRKRLDIDHGKVIGDILA